MYYKKMNKWNISMLTQLCKFTNLKICNLIKFTVNFPIDDKFFVGILYTEKRNGSLYRYEKGFTGISYSKQTFSKSITLWICPNEDYPNLVVVVKFFDNGKIQMTGATKLDIGNIIMSNLYDRLIKNDKKEFMESYCITGEELLYESCKIVMINTSKNINKKIRVSKVLQTLKENGFEIDSANKLRLYYNRNNKIQGICSCSSRCYDAKGDGIKDKDCNACKVTIQTTGKIQIMGSRKIEQLNWCQQFLEDEVHKIDKKPTFDFNTNFKPLKL